MGDDARTEAGAIGEQLARQFLSKRGLRLIARNYRCKGGELDLVMLDGKILALIEVRLRDDASFGGAAASVTPAKQKRLIHAAKYLLLTRKDLARYPARFDVVAITGQIEHEPKIEWIRDAFRE
jgi:putative endonuclease